MTVEYARLHLSQMDKSGNKKSYQSEFTALRNAIARCHRETDPSYADYGARGIYVFDDWRHRDLGFDRFLAHVGPKPSSDLWLDRLNNDAGYIPGNVAWRTVSQQNKNKRSWAVVISIVGVSKSLKKWSDLSGVDPTTIRSRIKSRRPEGDWLHVGRLPKRG